MISHNPFANPAEPPKIFPRRWGPVLFNTLAAAGFFVIPFQLPASVGEIHPPEDNATRVIVAVGAGGEQEYEDEFRQSAQLWQTAASKGEAKVSMVGLEEESSTNDLARLKTAIAQAPKSGPGELWLVLIGHGTFDGQEAKFNLRGPDLAAKELAEWLKPFQRPLAIINCASASGPFLNLLSGTNRVVVTSTKSGYEQNYARFGKYFSQALLDPEADLDKDGQVSLLEAFLSASRHVAEFYETNNRLATEHALIDDNGDGLGTPADWFSGLRPVKKAEGGASPDGWRAHQFYLVRSPEEQARNAAWRAHRDALELAILQLRESKDTLGEDDYYTRLETLLVELARLYAPDNAKAESEDGGKSAPKE